MEFSGTSGVVFRKLDPLKSEIRLLELQPADGIDQPPVCRLIDVALTDKLEYLAIACSHSETSSEHIFINSKKVTVPATLGQVLRHVRAVFLDSSAREDRSRSPNKEKKGPPNWLVQAMKNVRSIFPDPQKGRYEGDGPGTLLIWLEPLCINRRNPQETAQQLTHMAMVYRSAQIVVGWLGLKSELTDVALETLQQVEAVFPPHFGEPEDRKLHPENYAPQHQWLQKIDYLWEHGLDGPYYPALLDFTERPLFHRTWLIDEIAMSRYPAFLLGDRIVSWKQVITLNRLLEELKDNESAVFPPGLRPVAQSWPLGTIYTMLKHYEERKRKEEEEEYVETGVLREFEMKKQREQAIEIAGAGEQAHSEMRREKERQKSIATGIEWER
ncbi:Heterokaryon incompatibility protein 6, OR allele 13 [Seiridium cupressi]